MAVGEAVLPTLYPVAGFKLGTASAGVKRPGRLDLVVMEICADATVAAVFTQNAFCAAPVQLAKMQLQHAVPRYLVVNTGNANAGTGASGLANARLVCEALAALTKQSAACILPFSTGVIGEPLPVEKITTALPAALADLSADGWTRAAQGIMTTDTRPKAASRQVTVANRTITVTGIAKGAGMIKPNMATMLGYVATDAAIATDVLQNLLRQCVDRSFNRITIDGDTSTNDSCVLIATGKIGPEIVDEHHPAFSDVATAIESVFIELAQGLVRDGEGATKFVTVEINGGGSTQECLQVAYAIAESPLVKTALFASDPNWGRLLAAIGRAGVHNLDVEKVSVHLNGVLIAERGGRAASYTESAGAAAMAQENICIAVNLDRGEHSETVWTTDLSYDYVRINAEYRT